MRARLLTAAVIAAASVALAGAGAGPAQAVLLPACTGQNIHGAGSSLQQFAQAIWTAPTGFNTNGAGCVSVPMASYTASNSLDCMNSWHADGATAWNTAIHFCGTDAPPSNTQITNINAVLGNGGSGSSVITVPVAQAAIAIVANPPAGCTLSSITPADLEQVFRGAITTWAGITGSSGCGANTITRVVRADPSGTTYQLKHYLFGQNAGVVFAPSTTWADLQAPSSNTTWPGTTTASQSGCNNTGFPCAGGASSGQGDIDEVKTVGEISGALGFAALPSARVVFNPVVYPRLKWLGIKTAGVTIDPSTNGLSVNKAKSNCTTAVNAYGAMLPTPTTSWSAVYLVTPGTGYPLCTLTWDLALAAYTPRYGTPAGRRIATTVHDYLNYVVTVTGGQSDALGTNNDYRLLPTDVLAVSNTGVGMITD